MSKKQISILNIIALIIALIALICSIHKKDYSTEVPIITPITASTTVDAQIIIPTYPCNTTPCYQKG